MSSHVVLSGVLVVDDEDLIRSDMIHAIEDSGFTAYGASDAKEAVDQLKRYSDIDVTVLDVDLIGKVNGLELAHIIHESWPHIGIVVSSGLVRILNEDLPPRSVFLPKPYSQFDAMRVIRETYDATRVQ